MAETLTLDFDLPMPLFPLNNCALLPHATVPLHVFEPRYQAMMRDAIDSTGLIAMAVFEGDDWKTHYTGSPPLRDHVCVGHIVRHQHLPDGRYNILLQGICRARIVRELEHEHYRVALLEPTELDPPMEIDLAERREHVEALLSDPSLKQLAAVGAVQSWLSGEVPTTALVDLATLMLCQSVEERYRVLSEPSAEARALWLEHHLSELREVVRKADRMGPAMTEDGLSLN